MSCSDLLDEYPLAHQWPLICKITGYTVDLGSRHRVAERLRYNLYQLPTQESNTTAFNAFGNFPFTIYVTSLDHPPWTASSLDELIRNRNAVGCNSNEDGDMQLYDPSGKVLKQIFDD